MTRDDAGTLAFIGAMVPEVRPIVKRLGLHTTEVDGLTVHTGTAGGRPVVVAVTAIGTAAATDVTERVLDAFPVDHVAAIGVCGGIAADIAIGDLVTPVDVLDEASGARFRPAPVAGHEPVGTLMTTDVLHNDPSELDGFRARGIVAVDMETAAIGAACERRGVPWSVFRAVSDRAGDPGVDQHVLGLSRPDGSANPAAIARFLLTRPHRVPHLVRLGRGLDAAVGASTRAAMAAHLG
jgi:nucleoside phosphorylase